MPIFSTVGRRSPGTVLWFTAFYVVLILGSATMVYPFLLMVATAVSSRADYKDYRVIPRYLTDDRALMAKYVNEKYYDVAEIQRQYLVPLSRCEVDPVIDLIHKAGLENVPPDKLARQAADFEAFLTRLPRRLRRYGFTTTPGDIPGQTQILYQAHLEGRFKTVQAAREFLREELDHFLDVAPPRERPAARDWTPTWDNKFTDYIDWAEQELPVRFYVPVSGDGKYATYLKSRLSGNLDEFARRFVPCHPANIAVTRWLKALSAKPARPGLPEVDFLDLKLPAVQPKPPDGVTARSIDRQAGQALESELWSDFVRTRWPLTAIRFGRTEQAHRANGKTVAKLFVKYLTTHVGLPLDKQFERYRGEGSPIDWQGPEDVAPPTPRELVGSLRSHWQSFVAMDPTGPKSRGCGLPIELIVLDTVRQRYVEFLRERFADAGQDDQKLLAAIDDAYGLRTVDLDLLKLPVLRYDWHHVTTNAGRLRWDFIWRNFKIVLDYILLHGEAFANTFAFVFGMIAVALTVNPLCAYALSRFDLTYSHNVLLFLLATMAFPAEVVMIPNFLLLRDLGLLNTFGALLLPVFANGYQIFLLKGFFDTLPKDLYEAGSLDGASELRMFYQLTIPLCKPIFAYIALISFTAAYMTFLFALLVCQDMRMWTIMVWIYDLNAASQPITLQVAAFTIAALPTLVVFVLCQKVIMRGIILPQLH